MEQKVILHPKISPNGIPDFTNYPGKKFIIILDQNILIRLIRLITYGELKDEYSLKIISHLMVWVEVNNISLNSGLALMEYSQFHNDNQESSRRNNIFLSIFNKYSIKHWYDLALGRVKLIPKIESYENKDFSFLIENEHFKIHLLEMLMLTNLYFRNDVTLESKFDFFFQWVYENILICKYTTFFSAMLFANKSKIFKNIELNFETIVKICKNSAWDLTYLSFWSTQYYYEDDTEEVYLFATMDKELRDLFYITHRDSYDIFVEYFGHNLGNIIIDKIKKNYLKREMPKIHINNLDRMILIEMQKLQGLIT